MFGFSPFSQAPFSDLGGGGTVITLELLSGVSATATTGTVGVDVSVSLTGAVATGIIATLPTVSSSTITISGSQAAATLGTLRPTISAGLAGLRTSSSLGGLTPSVTTPQRVTLTLVGNLATTSQGGVTPFGGVILGLDGVSSIASSGVVGYELAFSIELNGNTAVGSVEKVVAETQIGLNNGVEGVAKAGDIPPIYIWENVKDDALIGWDSIPSGGNPTWQNQVSNSPVIWGDGVTANENTWGGTDVALPTSWDNINTGQR
jgi:hypothetical protein